MKHGVFISETIVTHELKTHHYVIMATKIIKLSTVLWGVKEINTVTPTDPKLVFKQKLSILFHILKPWDTGRVQKE